MFLANEGPFDLNAALFVESCCGGMFLRCGESVGFSKEVGGVALWACTWERCTCTHANTVCIWLFERTKAVCTEVDTETHWVQCHVGNYSIINNLRNIIHKRHSRLSPISFRLSHSLIKHKNAIRKTYIFINNEKPSDAKWPTNQITSWVRSTSIRVRRFMIFIWFSFCAKKMHKHIPT